MQENLCLNHHKIHLTVWKAIATLTLFRFAGKLTQKKTKRQYQYVSSMIQSSMQHYKRQFKSVQKRTHTSTYTHKSNGNIHLTVYSYFMGNQKALRIQEIRIRIRKNNEKQKNNCKDDQSQLNVEGNENNNAQPWQKLLLFTKRKKIFLKK